MYDGNFFEKTYHIYKKQTCWSRIETDSIFVCRQSSHRTYFLMPKCYILISSFSFSPITIMRILVLTFLKTYFITKTFLLRCIIATCTYHHSYAKGGAATSNCYFMDRYSIFNLQHLIDNIKKSTLARVDF